MPFWQIGLLTVIGLSAVPVALILGSVTLMLSCDLVGVERPGFWKAMGTFVLAAGASLALSMPVSCVLGVALSFVHPAVAVVAQSAVGIWLMALVYQGLLEIKPPKALALSLSTWALGLAMGLMGYWGAMVLELV